MTLGNALIEWESCGFDDIPTTDLRDLAQSLLDEINKRAKAELYQMIGDK